MALGNESRFQRWPFFISSTWGVAPGLRWTLRLWRDTERRLTQTP